MDADDLRDAVEAMCEYDVLGVPMAMRLGVRLGGDGLNSSSLRLRRRDQEVVALPPLPLVIAVMGTSPPSRRSCCALFRTTSQRPRRQTPRGSKKSSCAYSIRNSRLRAPLRVHNTARETHSIWFARW